MDNLIVDTKDWVPLGSIPSSSTQLSEAFWADSPTNAGVYIVAKKSDIEEIGEDLNHPKIGYIGMTTNLPYRVYSLRTKSHNCGSYIKNQKWEVSDIVVKIVFTEEDEASKLERVLHETQKEMTGKRFSWTAASAGNDGKTTQAETIIEKCNLEELSEIYRIVDTRLKQLLLDKHLEDMK